MKDSLFTSHYIEETYTSGWIPTKEIESWKKKMKEEVINKLIEEKEGYKVSYEFDERDTDFLNQSISRMVLIVELSKEGK